MYDSKDDFPLRKTGDAHVHFLCYQNAVFHEVIYITSIHSILLSVHLYTQCSRGAGVAWGVRTCKAAGRRQSCVSKFVRCFHKVKANTEIWVSEVKVCFAEWEKYQEKFISSGICILYTSLYLNKYVSASQSVGTSCKGFASHLDSYFSVRFFPAWWLSRSVISQVYIM